MQVRIVESYLWLQIINVQSFPLRHKKILLFIKLSVEAIVKLIISLCTPNVLKTFFTFSEYPHPAFNLTMAYKNRSTITFTWQSNTTGLYLKQLFYNITIYSQDDDSIIQQRDAFDKESIYISGLSQLNNYTVVLQSRNKYTYSLQTTNTTFLRKGKSICYLTHPFCLVIFETY